jgi:tetratricopeptide (TPR) repeat protein
LHKWEDAVGDYTQALQVDTDNALGYYNRGLARQRCGKLDQARDDLDHALTLSNDDHAGQLFSARGCLKERLGDVEDALADYSAALQREPSSANALRCSAASARARREYTEAIDLFSRLREVEPDDPTPLLGIGFSFGNSATSRSRSTITVVQLN